MPKRGNSDDPITRHPPHYLHELPLEEEERLEKLFATLDKDGNGTIDIHDLSGALKISGLHERYAEKFIQHSDKTKSGDVCLADFIHYVREHEKNLQLHFSDLDRNKDGKIDLDELIRAFNDLGIPLDKSEARNLLLRMDQDGSLNISYDEWRDYLLYAPSSDIRGLINFWRHSTLEAHNILRTPMSNTLLKVESLDKDDGLKDEFGELFPIELSSHVLDRH